MKNSTIAVDFDGTVVDHTYPEVGEDVPNAVRVLKQLIKNGNKIVLFTMRSGKELQDAVEWFEKNDIELYGINNNPTQHNWTDSPKAYANLYIDDSAFGCPLIKVSGFCKKCVDWEYVERKLL